MSPTKELYYKKMGYIPGEFVPCEITGGELHDANHIDARGMGGRPSMDFIENLIGLSRNVHLIVGDKKKYKDELRRQHLLFMKDRTPLYYRDPENWMLKEILNELKRVK